VVSHAASNTVALTTRDRPQRSLAYALRMDMEVAKHAVSVLRKQTRSPIAICRP
jgi:hypothetical protein